MKIFKSDEIENTVLNLVYRGKQFHGRTIFLTLKQICMFSGRGCVDFGGSEYVEAEKEVLNPEKRRPEDKFGWWDLDSGTYHMEFNERFESDNDRLYIISSSRRILSNGAFHPTIVTVESKYSPRALLIVGSHGISIKENARISLCKVFEI